MGDMGDDFRAMRAHRKEKHERWHRENRAAIDASRISYIERDEALLFRLCGIRADFYPSTGRWREIDGKTYRGGAQAFLEWLRKAVVARGRFCAPSLHRGGPVATCGPSKGGWSLCPLCGAEVCTRCDEPHSASRCDP